MSFSRRMLKSVIRLVQSRAIAYNLEEKKPRIGVYPYISGDAFLAISDIAFLRDLEGPVDLGRNSLGKVVFYETGQITIRKNELISAAVVIVHNGDAPLNQEEISLFKKFGCCVFATNSQRQEGFIEPIPIGIENAHHRRNGSLHYYNPINFASLSLENKKDVLVSFSVHTNPTERKRVLEICQEYRFENEKMKLAEFRQRLAESRFVISPPGNGVDCHRTWEAMYHKTVPVIETRYNLFQHIELPILTVNSYHDFFKLSLDERSSLYQKIMSRGYPALYMDYWIELINKARNAV
jgi:hypothetical protein